LKMEISQKRVEGKQQDILWSNEKIKSIRLSETLPFSHSLPT
jgi:hypothetical protein